MTRLSCDTTLTTVAPAVPSDLGSWQDQGGGEYCQTNAGGGTPMAFDNVCEIEVTLNALTGNPATWSMPIQFNDWSGAPQDLNFGTAGFFETQMGDPAPVGSSGSVLVGDTTVTLTALGPSSNLRIAMPSGALVGRLNDADGQEARFRLSFSNPVRKVFLVDDGSNCPAGVKDITARTAIDLDSIPGNCC